MMRRQSCTHTLLTVLLLGLLALVSQQSQAKLEPLWDTCPSVCAVQTATVEGRVRVIITKTKTKLYLPKIPRPLARTFINDDNDDYYDETPEFQIGYRRPDLIDQATDTHDDLSDEIKLRLILARKRALEAYNRTWG
jgi:hypothetical protein